MVYNSAVWLGEASFLEESNRGAAPCRQGAIKQDEVGWCCWSGPLTSLHILMRVPRHDAPALPTSLSSREAAAARPHVPSALVSLSQLPATQIRHRGVQISSVGVCNPPKKFKDLKKPRTSKEQKVVYKTKRRVLCFQRERLFSLLWSRPLHTRRPAKCSARFSTTASQRGGAHLRTAR